MAGENDKFKEGYLNVKEIYNSYHSEYNTLVTKSSYLIPVVTFIAGGFFLLIKELLSNLSISGLFEFIIFGVVFILAVMIVVICGMTVLNILKALSITDLEYVVYNELDATYIENHEEKEIYVGLANKYISANITNKKVVDDKASFLKIAQGKLKIIIYLSVAFLVLFSLYLLLFKVKYIC